MTKKAENRVYIVPQQLDDKTNRPDRLVRATSRAAAMLHIAEEYFPVRIATHDELIASISLGIDIEEAVTERPATKPEPQP